MTNNFTGTPEQWVEALEDAGDIWGDAGIGTDQTAMMQAQFMNSLGIWTYCDDITAKLAPEFRATIRHILDIDKDFDKEQSMYIMTIYTPVLALYASWGSSPWSAYFDVPHPKTKLTDYHRARGLAIGTDLIPEDFKFTVKEDVENFFRGLLLFYDKHFKQS